ncbi:MAG: hypothetical protein IPK12_08355 [Gemmatimonadetes bacterium]|nr:hypothetical protein [Gemmatimonadota bacterium]
MSGTEEKLGAWIVDWARAQGMQAAMDDASVWVTVPGKAAGSTLAFVSHIDTVPAGEGWTRPPFEATFEGDKRRPGEGPPAGDPGIWRGDEAHHHGQGRRAPAAH